MFPPPRAALVLMSGIRYKSSVCVWVRVCVCVCVWVCVRVVPESRKKHVCVRVRVCAFEPVGARAYDNMVTLNSLNICAPYTQTHHTLYYTHTHTHTHTHTYA